MAQTKKKSAFADPPPSDEELRARVRAAVAERALSKSDLTKKLGASSKADVARVLDIARELARQGELYRIVKARTESFYRDDPVAALDRAVPELLRAQGPLGAAALKKAVKAALPGYDGFVSDWTKAAVARRVIYECGPPKAFSAEPPALDVGKLLEKPLATFKRQLVALQKKGVALEVIAEHVLSALGLAPRPSTSPPAGVAPTPSSAAPPHATCARGTRASREIFLEALRRLAADSPEGALLPVRELRARAGLDKHDFDAAALALSKEGLLVLHHHDHPSALSEAEQNALVRDALGRHYVGVALRGSA